MNKLVYFLFFCFTTNISFGQITIQGKIVDAETGQALIGAAIFAPGTTDGIATNLNGEFSFTTKSDSVQISYVGYEVRILSIEEANGEIQLRQTGIDFEECFFITAPSEIYEAAPVIRIDQNALNRDNRTTLTPALNRIPGILAHSGALNTNRITLRGIGNRSPFATTKIRAYLDDIPLTSGIGETTLEDIDLSLIEQIQIWKGPTASKYGAGLGGMIHLKTQNRTGYERSSLSSSFTVGSYGLIRNTDNLTIKSNKQDLRLHLGFNTTHSDGYRDNNEYDRWGVTALTRFGKNKSQWTALLNYISLKSFIPSSLNQNDFDNAPQKAAFTWASVSGFEDYTKGLTGLSNEYDFGNSFKNVTSLFFSWRDAYEVRPFNILEENSKALGLRTRFEKVINNSNFRSRKFSLGFEHFRERYAWQTFETLEEGAQGAMLSDNEEIRQYSNIFAETKIELSEKWFVESGLNLNFTNYDYDDLFNSGASDKSGDYTFDALISPRLALGYRIAFDQTIYAMASHGFSPPTLEETLTPDGQINPNIQPEKGWNFELGLKGFYWNKLDYEISLFSMHVKDLLVADRISEDQYVGINAGKTIHNGLEINALYRIAENGPLAINLFTTYTYSNFKFDQFVDEDEDYSGNKLTGTAPHIFNTGIDLRTNFGLYGNINYQFVDALPMRDDNSIFSEAYQISNLKVGFTKTFAKKWTFDISGGINNLFDKHYASMILINAGSFGGNAPRYYYPGLPMNFYGGLSLKYLFSS